MTQIRLAQLTGIAPDHIRNLENSRRPLNHAQLDKIRHAIGATWDSERKAWMKHGLGNESFTYEWFLVYRTLQKFPEYQTNIDTHMLCRRLQALLQGVEPSDYSATFYRIFDALEEIRTELKVGAAKRVFEKTAFKIEYWADQKTRKLGSIERSYPFADSEIKQGALLDLTPYACPLIHVEPQPEKQQPAKGFRFITADDVSEDA